MTSKHTMALMLAAATLLPAPLAAAVAPDCSPEPVQADAAVRAQWPDLLAAIQAALEGRDDVDPCARIALRQDHAGLLLRVNLLDGRSAARTVSRKEDVVPTLVALLMLPEAGAAAAAPAASAAGPTPAVPAAAPARPDAGSATVTLDAAVSAEPARARPHPAAAAGGISRPAVANDEPVRLDLSLSTGGRAGDGYRGFSLGVLTAFEMVGWLVGLEGAAAFYEKADDGPSTSSLLLALVAGRRFRFAAPSTLAVDLTAGPALAVRGFGSYSAVRVPAASDGPVPPPENDGPWARLVASAHLSFRARSFVRPFAGVEGEAALGTWAAAASVAPHPPAWTLGLVIGVALGTP